MKEKTGRRADWVDYVARWMIASEVRPGILGPRLVMGVSAILFAMSVTGIINGLPRPLLRARSSFGAR